MIALNRPVTTVEILIDDASGVDEYCGYKIRLLDAEGSLVAFIRGAHDWGPELSLVSELEES